MEVRIKLLRGAEVPEYKTSGAVGCDLAYVPSAEVRARVNSKPIVALEPNETCKVPLGVAVEIPEGYEGQLTPRSSISLKGLLVHVGRVDCDYRGELHATITNVSGQEQWVNEGDRVCQLVIAPVARASFEAVDELSETARGEGGFGSTGR